MKIMNSTRLVRVAMLAGMVSLQAQQMTRRANINGSAIDGKCTIEVSVDGAAEVEVQGDQGTIRNLSGQRASWRRFECNGRMPANPHDFRFRGIDGRGDVQLLQDPRPSGGRIVFRIDDPQGGREGYTVDLEWRGSNNGQWSSQDSRRWRGPDYRDGSGARNPGGPDRGGLGNGGRDRRYYDERGRWNTAGTARATEICQRAAAQRLQRDGFRNVTFQNLVADNNPGRNDYILGVATARRGLRRNTMFNVACAVNLGNGNVRSLEVTRR